MKDGRMGHPSNTPEKFWKRTERINGCLEYKGTLNKHGYGEFYFSRSSKKKWSAHRLSYFLTYGDIPKGLCVLHKCDNPSCVDPQHLRLGTLADNSKDMVLKGRSWHPVGELHPMAKLKKENIFKIKELYKTGNYTHVEIGKRFGISPSHICLILKGGTWKNL